MSTDIYFFILLAIFVFALLVTAIRILREYERGVVFTLGRFSRVAGPGLVILIPVLQQMVRTDLRTVVDVVPPQDVITRDNVSVKVNAVIYFRIVDPQRAIINVANYMAATSQLAQTTLHFWRNATGSITTSKPFSTSTPTRGASKCRMSRSRTWILMKAWCAR